MTDITNQDKLDAREWAEKVGPGYVGTQDELATAARVILATVDAPAPTLAEELRQWADKTFIEPGYRAILDEIIQRAEQIEQEREAVHSEVKRLAGILSEDRTKIEDLTAERDNLREVAEDANRQKRDAVVAWESCAEELATARAMRHEGKTAAEWMEAYEEAEQDRLKSESEVERLTRNVEIAEQDRDHANETCRELHRDVADLTDKLDKRVTGGTVYATPDGRMSQIQHYTFRPADTLPDPADVPAPQAWIVDTERYGRAVAFRSEDGTGSPWRFASEISTGRLLDCAVTLVSRLVPAPRVITTEEERDALPRLAVIIDADNVVCQRSSLGSGWYTTETTDDQTHYIKLPATVLWTPEVAS